MVDPLLAFRAEFPILDRTTYLVSNSLGAMPRGVPDRLAEYVDEWAELGVRAWAGAEGWWRKPVEVGNEIAPLIGAPLPRLVRGCANRCLGTKFPLIGMQRRPAG